MTQDERLLAIMQSARDLALRFHMCKRDVEVMLDCEGYLPKRWQKMTPANLVREVENRKLVARRVIEKAQEEGKIS